MKNPRGYFLSGLFLIAALLFAMGSVQGNPVKGNPLYQSEITNSPPVQIVSNVIIETPIFQVVNEPSVSTQIVRGVSVPYLGLMISSIYVNSNQCQFSSLVGDVAFNLGLRSASCVMLPISKEIKVVYTANRLRGVNTRLDIGEGRADIS